MLVGTYDGQFQLPNNPNQRAPYSLTGLSDIQSGFNAVPSSSLNEQQQEENHFIALSYQKSVGGAGMMKLRAAVSLTLSQR